MNVVVMDSENKGEKPQKIVLKKEKKKGVTLTI